MPVRNNTNRVPYFKDCPKPLTFSPRNIIIIKRTKFACLAQPVEHAAVNRSVGGSSPSTGARKHLMLRCFFLALFEDLNPARSARFRHSRNDTADTALDAIGTPCNDRYSGTSFLTGVRVLCEGVTPSRSHAFYYKNAPKAAGETAVFGAILYKSKGCGDDIPAGVQGRRPCCLHNM